MRFTFTYFICLQVAVDAIRILSPLNLAEKKLVCPPMTAVTGPQKDKSWNTTERVTEVVLLRPDSMRDLCKGKKLSYLYNKVVLITEYVFCPYVSLEDWYRLFLKSGPLAVVSIATVYDEGGYNVNLWEAVGQKRENMQSGSTYFLSCGGAYKHIWDDLLEAAKEQENGNYSNVELFMEIDANPWQEHWQSAWWWFVARLFGPTWGFLIIWYSLNILRVEVERGKAMKLRHYALINECIAVGCFSVLMLLGGLLADDIIPWGLQTITFTGFTGIGFVTTLINSAVFHRANEQLLQLLKAESPDVKRSCCGAFLDQLPGWDTGAEISQRTIAAVFLSIATGMLIDVGYSFLIGNNIIPHTSVYIYWQVLYLLGQFGMSIYLYATVLPMMSRLRALTENWTHSETKIFATAFKHMGQWITLLAFFQFMLPALTIFVFTSGSHLNPAGNATWFPIISLLRIAQGWAQVCPYITWRSRAFLVDWDCIRLAKKLSRSSGIKILASDADDEDEDEGEYTYHPQPEESNTDTSWVQTISEESPEESISEISGASIDPHFHENSRNRSSKSIREERPLLNTLKHATYDLALLAMIDVYIFVIAFFYINSSTL